MNCGKTFFSHITQGFMTSPFSCRWWACVDFPVPRTQQRWPTMPSWMEHPSLEPQLLRHWAVWTPRPWLWPWDTLYKSRLNVSFSLYSSSIQLHCHISWISGTRQVTQEGFIYPSVTMHKSYFNVTKCKCQFFGYDHVDCCSQKAS